MQKIFIILFFITSLLLFPIKQNIIAVNLGLLWWGLGALPFNTLASICSICLFFKDKKWRLAWLFVSLYSLIMLYFVNRAENQWWEVVDRSSSSDLDVDFTLAFFRIVYFGVLLPLLLVATRFIWLNRDKIK